MMSIKRGFWTKVAEFKYRRIPYGICCCGCDMEGHSVWDNHSPRDAKEYAITSYVESKTIGVETNDY